MPKSRESMDEPGTWIFRGIPRDLMRRVKSATALKGKTVRGLVIALVEAYLGDPELFEKLLGETEGKRLTTKRKEQR